MNRSRIILVGSAAIVLVAVLIAGGILYRRFQSGGEQDSLRVGTGMVPIAGSASGEKASQPPFNAFSPSSGPISLSGNSGISSSTFELPIYQGKTVTTVGEIAAIIASSTEGTALAALLPLPDVADSEIAISATGISNITDYLIYFNTNATKDIPFDYKRFANVLKDENGIFLLTPELVDKAFADNNFAEVHDSLVVQKDFATAEISYLDSIKVSPDIAPFHKETIAMEKLLIEFIDKTFAAESGKISKADLADYEQKFVATAEAAHQQFLTQSGAVALAPEENWFDRLLTWLGLRKPALAFGLVFGGRIGVPIPCLCSAGFWLFVGPPKPASLFVPFAFIASPFFHIWKSLRPGVWWLGLQSPAVIPCLQVPFCFPMGAGNLIVTAGTSLF